jgi:hypothetical protein
MRPFSHVPLAVRLALAAALVLQLLWQRPVLPERAALPPAPSRQALALASLGDPVALSRMLLVYVQSHDDQPGVTLALNDLDYPVLRDWLERISALDPQSQAPLLAASQVYTAADPARTRVMLDFVQRHDRDGPWRRHAALVARHKLHDTALADTLSKKGE